MENNYTQAYKDGYERAKNGDFLRDVIDWASDKILDLLPDDDAKEAYEQGYADGLKDRSDNSDNNYNPGQYDSKS